MIYGGIPIRGLWPSEGSVSDEALGLAANSGYKWLASDQAVLYRSEFVKEGTPSHFVSYDWSEENHSIRCYFRDHALSDAIGFRYSTLSAEAATKEFLSHLEVIESGTRGVPGRCAVIALDGENPWESYRDGGESFLNTLFRSLESHPRLTTMTFSEHMEKGTREHIRSIHSGSWIDSNFRIWIGDPEKNQAWSELGRTHQIVDGLIAGDPCLEVAWSYLMKAECSDWFWWFGEPFHSAYDEYYDELFRSFLKAVYNSAGCEYPVSLDSPITAIHHIERRIQPAFPISPIIDGKETSFYEWMGGCKIDPRQYGAMMGRSEELVNLLFYGFNEQELLFRIDLSSQQVHQNIKEIVLYIYGERWYEFSIPIGDSRQSANEEGWKWVKDEILEIAVEHSKVSIRPGGECKFWIEIRNSSAALEKLPPAGDYHFHIPTHEELTSNWIV